MSSSIIRFIIIILLWGSPQAVSAAQEALQKSFQMGLIRVPGCESFNPVVGKMPIRGIRPTTAAAPLQEAGAEKSQPMSKKQLLELIVAGVPNQRAVELVTARGIDFQVDDEYVRTLRHAGADDAVIAALRKASVNTVEVTVETGPSAQVFFDGDLKGPADAQGMLAIQAKPGPHALKVSAAGKQDFEQSVTVAAGQPIHIVAPLLDLPGSARVKGPSGAAIWLDDANRGAVDSSGDVLISGIQPGAHLLRVTAPGKVADSRSLNVFAGLETQAEVALADGVRVNPQDSLKYVWIPPGTFMMGCSPGDNECYDYEKPAHQVTLQSSYWIGQTEVTVGAYRLFVEAVKLKMPPVAPKQNRGWKNESFPIVDVTWGEANQYCAWAGGRLPTEAEWEYASRGGSPQARYGSLSQIAWTKANAQDQTHEVGAKLPNGFGLYDTLGNVWEWVNDWYDVNYYQHGAAQNPAGPATGMEKVLRGGSWIVDARLLRASDRYSIKPDARSDYFGFRCVWSPKTP